jgi:hypothetical protein
MGRLSVLTCLAPSCHGCAHRFWPHLSAGVTGDRPADLEQALAQMQLLPEAGEIPR